MTIPNFIDNFCSGKCCLNSIAASAEHLCQYAEEYMGGLGAKSAAKNSLGILSVQVFTSIYFFLPHSNRLRQKEQVWA